MAWGDSKPRKKRSDAGVRRNPNAQFDEIITFRVNRVTDKVVWDLIEHYRQQNPNLTYRSLFFWALLNASGTAEAPTNGLPEQSLQWLRDELINYLETHQMVVAADSDEDSGRPTKKVSKDDKNFFKTLFSGFADDEE